MRRRTLSIATMLMLMLLQAPAAHAKGPAGATIEGEGVKGQLEIDQAGELGQGTAMSRLVEAVGFFDLIFGKSKKATAYQPKQSLGELSLVIAWDMGGGDTIVQDVYLDAAGGPVTYVAPGQEFWEDTAATTGGWMVVRSDIAGPLVELGVAESAVSHLLTKKSAKKGAIDALGDKGDAVKEPGGTKSESYDKPSVVAGGTPPSTAVQSPAPNAPNASPSAAAPGFAITPIFAALLLIAAIIGAGAWMRMRRPMPR